MKFASPPPAAMTVKVRGASSFQAKESRQRKATEALMTEANGLPTIAATMRRTSRCVPFYTATLIPSS
jgi:hypothetical protein